MWQWSSHFVKKLLTYLIDRLPIIIWEKSKIQKPNQIVDFCRTSQNTTEVSASICTRQKYQTNDTEVDDRVVKWNAATSFVQFYFWKIGKTGNHAIVQTRL